jgi:integrase
MDLAYLTGQRPADVLKIDVRHVRDGVVEIRQNKTNAQLRIEVVGELAALIERINARRASHTVQATRLIVDEVGRPLGQSALRFRFDRAREAAGIEKAQFQFRDLRAKAGTDKEALSDMRQAQTLLGHGSISMTEHYVRKRGMRTKPTR